SRWYQRLLGCQSAHGGREYERLVSGDRLILQLHRWDVEHHHGRIGDPNITPYGNGVLLWFELDEFDAAVARGEELKAEIVLPRHRIRPMATAVRTIGKSGCAIPTATRSCSPVRTAQRMEIGHLNVSKI